MDRLQIVRDWNCLSTFLILDRITHIGFFVFIKYLVRINTNKFKGDSIKIKKKHMW